MPAPKRSMSMMSTRSELPGPVAGRLTAPSTMPRGLSRKSASVALVVPFVDDDDEPDTLTPCATPPEEDDDPLLELLDDEDELELLDDDELELLEELWPGVGEGAGADEELDCVTFVSLWFASISMIASIMASPVSMIPAALPILRLALLNPVFA